MLYQYLNNSVLEEALQFWTRGSSLDLCVAEKSHVPYLRHNVIDLIGQPDRMVGDKMYYNRQPVSLYSMEESGDEIPDGAFYIPSSEGDTISDYGFCVKNCTNQLALATMRICQGIEPDVINLMKD